MDDLTPFKKGFVHLALDTKNSQLYRSSRTKHTSVAQHVVSRCFPGDLHIEVLPPIDTTHWTQETPQRASR